MSTRLPVYLAAILAAQPAAAVVIDDFTAGPIVVATSGEQFDGAADLQTGLPADSVLTGNRSLSVQQVDASVSLSVNATGAGAFNYAPTDDRGGINTFIRYVAEAPVDLTPAGENALVFGFESASFFSDNGFFTTTTGFLDIDVRSTAGSAYQYVRVPSSDVPFNLAIPFSLLGNFDPTQLTDFRFGTGNGNLHGPFTLTSIESRYVEPGDYNADGLIDLADYTLWRDMAASDFYVYHADGNGDGVVDAADHQVWLDAMTTSPAGVPEPSTYVAIATLLLSQSRRELR